MKALSVQQPWANMIVSGVKTIETRVWKTKYRGNILIVSSRFPEIALAGYALAIVDLIDCRKMIKSDEVKACCEISVRTLLLDFKECKKN
jgi:hypothetical protein